MGWLVLYPAILLLGYCVLRGVRGPRPLPRYIWSLGTRIAVALVLLLPLIAGPVWIVVAVLDVPSDYRTGAATGTIIATGWVVAFILQQFEGARARDQTRVDVLVALQQEVFSCVERLDERPIRAEADAAQARILAEEVPPYVPLPASEGPPTVFEAMRVDVKVIDPDTLEEVLRFYAAYSDLRAFIDDFRSEAFRALPPDRMAAAHEVLTERRVAALFWALKALRSINAALGLADPDYVRRSGHNSEITADRQGDT